MDKSTKSSCMHSFFFRQFVLKGAAVAASFLMTVICPRYSVSLAQNHAAQDVIRRLIPKVSSRFTFEQIPTVNGYDVFEVEASGGNVTVRGSTQVTMCRGAYDYLKNDCKCLVTWDGDQLNLPNPLPDASKRRVICPVKFRHYLNQCTFSYSTAFWDWERWEKEIDWMALHGINMPLSMNGQEKIWQSVFESYGFTNSDLNAFFIGPAFLAFQRMGCLYGYMGPLPQNFIDNQALLQKKILNRERELGMLPVTPGFSGFVPGNFKQRVPNAKTVNSASWCGFPPTLLVEPRDPVFAEISRKFIQQYKKEYGELSGYYLIDLFIEMDPQVNVVTKNQELRVIGDGVYKGLNSADPKAIWVIQGWPYHNSSGFWDNAAIAAFQDSVPNDRMIILDLACDKSEVWRNRPAVAERQVIWNMLHNYGQRTQLQGILNDAAIKPIKALQQLGQSHMVGMGCTMEGIEQNSVMYELLCDMMWRTTSPDIDAWVASYAHERYGSSAPSVSSIWSSIFNIFYKSANSNYPTPYQVIGPKQNSPDCSDIRNLIVEMLAAAPDFKNNPLFIRDLVDVSKRYFGEKSANFIVRVLNSSGAARTQAKDDFNIYMTELDALLSTVPQYRMDRWIAMARSLVPDTDKNLMEQNARAQVTTWVNPSILSDYARKEWSGLVKEYYLGQWNLYFDGQSKSGFCDNWVMRTNLAPTKTVDPVSQVKLLLSLTNPGN